ncbi:MAG: amidohydrolase family protein [Acidimicrobiia bacterium]
MRVIFTTLDGSTLERGVEEGRWTDPAGGPVNDLSTSVAVPGLVDGHAHLAHADMDLLEPGDPNAVAGRAFAAVESGVFLVYDKGSCDTVVLSLSDQPPAVRPHLQAAGRIIAGDSGYFPGYARETDEAGLVEAVREGTEASAGWVKIVGDWPRKGIGPVPNFGEQALAAAVGVAHKAGCRVAIHTMAPDVASMAVRAGVDSIEHGLYLNDDDIRLLGRRRGMWVPTVMRMEAVVAQFGVERTAGRVVSEGLDRVRSLLPGARDSGVVVLAGTDLTVPSSRVASEALRLIDYGLTPEGAVAALTVDGWRAADLDADFRVGASADLVAFDRHPTEDPTTLCDPVFVMRAGTVYRSGT